MLCNCRIKYKCPDYKFSVENMVFKSTISSASKSKIYLSFTGGTIKKKDGISTSMTSKFTKKTSQTFK